MSPRSGEATTDVDGVDWGASARNRDSRVCRLKKKEGKITVSTVISSVISLHVISQSNL